MDFVKSHFKIRDKDILKKLEETPYFKLENEYIRINNVLVLVFMAHKIKLKFPWERFLNYIVTKYFIISIFE